MNRHLAAFAATAATVALAGAALALPASASASAQAPIRTLTGHGSVQLTGRGASKWWHDDYSESWSMALSPKFEAAISYHSSYFKNRKPVTFNGHQVITGHTSYVKDGNGAWKRGTLTGAELRADINGNNPYTSQAQLGALHGAHQVAAGEFQASGSYAQVGSFLDSEFLLPAAAVTGNGIKTVTIDLWDGPAGRPVKVTASGASSTTRLQAQETFGGYNKPVSIHAPA